MIIELFGPPGAGKTTFANLLMARLRERGSVAEPVLSYRPAERAQLVVPLGVERRRPHIAIARRLARPVVEMVSMALRPAADAQGIGTAADLLKIFPPGSFLSAIRMKQYITRLSHSWHRASGAPGFVLFDQAYVQVICSLALLHGEDDDGLVGKALDCAPKADLLIHLDAPRDVLEARLQKRRHRQGPFERLLEPDVQRSLRAAGMTARLDRLLHERSRPVVRVDYLDENSLPDAARQIAEQLTAKPGTGCQSSMPARSARPGLADMVPGRMHHHG